MAEPLVQFERVSFHPEGARAVFDGLDESLERGARLLLAAGPRGEAACLLRLAAGILHPQEGRVLLDGIPLGPYAFDHPFLRRGAVGWMPREGGLLANQSLRMNVALPLMFTRGMGHGAALEKASEALRLAGLEDLADCRPHALEPGERWLGALARAAAGGPELWLVEEPAADLEPARRDAASALLEEALASPATVVLAGSAGWFPAAKMQAIRWVDGRMVPEKA